MWQRIFLLFFVLYYYCSGTGSNLFVSGQHHYSTKFRIENLAATFISSSTSSDGSKVTNLQALNLNRKNYFSTAAATSGSGTSSDIQDAESLEFVKSRTSSIVTTAVQKALVDSGNGCELETIDVDPFTRELCGSAPLCGDDPVYSSINYKNVTANAYGLTLSECCPVKDTRPTSDCQTVNHEQSCRVVGLKTPFCDRNDPNQQCSQLDLYNRRAEIIVKYGLQEAETTSCCQSCTCYGDPHCVSFENIIDQWILCDARDRSLPNKPASTCEIKKDKCLQQFDHDENPCQWIEPKKGESWDLELYGSQCVYNFISSEPYMLMYAADDFRFEVRMGERGVIDKVKLYSGDQFISLTGTTCLYNSYNKTWFENDENYYQIPQNMSDYFIREVDYVNNFDVIWRVTDAATNIKLKIRCTASKVGDKVASARINVEELVEVDDNFRFKRKNMEGFCFANAINKTGSTENTDLIESGNGCTPNDGATDGKIDAARAICNNPALQSDQVDSCFEMFCSAYYFPNYDSKKACKKNFAKNARYGFCKSMKTKTSDVEKCVNTLKDFGWQVGVSQYLMNMYNHLESSPAINTMCGSKPDDFPRTLEDCQKGTLVQYLIDIDNAHNDAAWITHLVIPDHFLPCDETLVFSPENDYALFVNPIRFKQCNVNEKCIKNICDTQAGLRVDFDFYETAFDETPPPNCPTNNLCSEEPLYLPPSEESAEGVILVDDLDFESCCGVHNGDILELPLPPGCGNNDDQSQFSGQECRLLGMNEPFCNPSDFTKNCTTNNLAPALLQLQLSFEARNESCCKTCSCYGDPHCKSFNDFYDTWILCDARQPISKKNNECEINKKYCRSLKDHDGNSCEWIANPDPSTPWEVALYGSQCVPNQKSSESWLLLYSADSFVFEAQQTERSTIENVQVQLKNNNFITIWKLNAQDCWNSGFLDSWQLLGSYIFGDEDYSVPVQNPLADYLFNMSFSRFSEFESTSDVVWNIRDYETGIRVNIRCAAPVLPKQYRPAVYGKPFINVEAIVEPEEDFGIVRDNLDGFCFDNNLNKKGSIKNTDAIMRGEGCIPWTGQGGTDEELDVARLLCNNPTMSKQGIPACQRGFCDAYYYPNLESSDKCLQMIQENYALGFCSALNSNNDDILECENYIHDFGWDTAIERYLIFTSANKTAAQCARYSADLPASLTKCQAGVTLQYLKNPLDVNSWTNYVAFPETIKLCQDFAFDGVNDTVLFTKKIRLKQCTISDTCAMNFCAEQNAVTTTLQVRNLNATKIIIPTTSVVDGATGEVSVICNDDADFEGSFSNETLQEQIEDELEASGLIEANSSTITISIYGEVVENALKISLSGKILPSIDVLNNLAIDLCLEISRILGIECADSPSDDSVYQTYAKLQNNQFIAEYVVPSSQSVKTFISGSNKESLAEFLQDEYYQLNDYHKILMFFLKEKIETAAAASTASRVVVAPPVVVTGILISLLLIKAIFQDGPVV